MHFITFEELFVKDYTTVFFFNFGIYFLENKDISMYGHFIVIFLLIGIANRRIFHLFQLLDFVDLEVGVLPVMVNDKYL